MSHENELRSTLPMTQFIIGVTKEYHEILRSDVFHVTYMFPNNRGYRLVVNAHDYVVSGMECVFNDACLIKLVGDTDSNRYDMCSYIDHGLIYDMLKDVTHKSIVTDDEKKDGPFFDPKV